MPAAFKKPRERIICACFVTLDGSCELVPIETLPMDYYNRQLKLDPSYVERITSVTRFVTNHGRTVDSKDGFRIAVDAGQVETTRVKGLLCITDIFQY